MSWILFLAISVFASALYPLIYFGYRRMLTNKRDDIVSLMSRGASFKSYLKAFCAFGDSLPADEEDQRKLLIKTIERLFDAYYDWRTYLIPIFICSIVSFVACSLALAKAGAGADWLPKELAELGRRVPAVTIAALAGAYVWGLYEMVRNFIDLNLSPTRIHLIWLDLLIAPILGYVVALPLNDSSKLVAGFAVGALPLKQLLDFVQTRGAKLLNMESTGDPAEAPTLQNLQGITKEMLITLNDECISSSQHLAQADPIKLLLRTPLEWKIILDLIDQAYLFSYLGEKIVALHPFGIRGAIEMASLYEGLSNKDETVRKAAEQLLDSVSSSVGQSAMSTRNLITTLYEDVQVDFIWELWGDLAADPDDPKSSKSPEHSETIAVLEVIVDAPSQL